MLKKYAKHLQKTTVFTNSELKRPIIWVLVVMMMLLSSLPAIKTNDKSPEVKPIANEQVAKQEDKEQISEKNVQQAVRTVQTPKVSRGNLNRDEVMLLAMVIQGEAANEPFEGKVAVGSVILNRMESDQFPNTLSGVVYQKAAFEAVANNMYKRPLRNESINAAQEAIEGGDSTNGALYFWNPATAQSKWVWTRPVTDKIGQHVFAK